MEIAGGLGPTAGKVSFSYFVVGENIIEKNDFLKVWRIGLMGSNATPEVARKALAAFGEALQVD